VAARILHLSDLHLGRKEDLGPLEAVRELAARIEPELVVTTGDMSHRGRRDQLERAAALVHGIGLPSLSVPGNHDIPYTFPARFTRTFAGWEHAFDTTEPVYSSESLVVVGVNSVRPWRQQGGALDDDQLASVAARLGSAPTGAFRVVALHHHLAAPPWPSKRKEPIQRRDQVLRAFAEAGVELVLSGHVHQTSVAERREFETVEEGTIGSLVLATVPGIGRPRPYRRGEARGVNAYEVGASTLEVTTYAWGGTAFAEVGRRSFARA
jgi:3',5'-cyclic AMP phosphodiesterase CpdA